jgi:mannose-6-phosphate isomerase
MTALVPFHLLSEFRDYVWGGDRLRPGYSPTAEAWVVYDQDRIADGPFAGRSLGELSSELGASLLGNRALKKTGVRFPLLIKLLDCAQWLSVQVHPNDAQARALEGPGFFGKTEAWHVVEAEPGAEIMCGLATPTEQEKISAAVREGKIMPYLRRMQVHDGETIFIRPGTLHALGPGLLIYEIQQTSDLTYRVWDWDRPASSGRKLHIDQSLAVIDPHIIVEASSQSQPKVAAIQSLVACDYFELERISGKDCRFELDTGGETFHALTVISGRARVETQGWQGRLELFETILVPAACYTYAIIPDTEAQILRASLPGE